MSWFTRRGNGARMAGEESPAPSSEGAPSSSFDHDTAPVIELTGVGKRFGNVSVIQDVDLTVPPGQIVGLIGPSGCGKTTVVRLAVGLLAPTSGEVRVFGRDPTQFGTRDRERIGYMPQAFMLYPTLSVQQNASFVGGLYGVGWLERRRRTRRLLEEFDLWEHRHRLARDLSGGMQRRLSLVTALSHDPELLFADEPTAGLDPILRARIWDHLRAIRDRGVTIVLTTQYIDEAANCDTIGVMNGGRLVAVDSPSGLRRRATHGEVVEVEIARPIAPEDIAALRQLAFVQAIEWTSDRALRARVADAAVAAPDITRALEGQGTSVVAVRPFIPSFDEVFMELVKE